MNNTITVFDLITQCTNLILVHGPDLIKSVFITLFESFVFLLEEKEISGKFLVVLGHGLVVFGVSRGLGCESHSDVSEDVLVLSLPLLETLNGGLVDLFSFSENSVVEVELLFI